MKAIEKLKMNGNWKTFKTAIITAIVTLIVSVFGSQAIGMFQWKSTIDTEMAVIKQDCVNTKEKVKSVEDKIDKIYEFILSESKKK